MLRMFRPEVQALKKVFHSLPYALYSITVSNPYEEIVYIINTFFEINKENDWDKNKSMWNLILKGVVFIQILRWE